MTDFSTLSTHNIYMFSYPFIYLKPEKGTPFRQSPSVKATIENSSYPLPLEEIKSPSLPYSSLNYCYEQG